MNNGFKTVLMDLDGLLLDTEKIYIPCWIEAAKFYGYKLSWNDALRLRSLDSIVAEKYIETILQTPGCYLSIRQKRKELMDAILNVKGLQTKPGAAELIRYLNDHHIPMAIVTSAPRERASGYLALAGLDFKTDHIVSASDVNKGKPYPDIYLYACNVLNVKPMDCIVLEDSPNGVWSAHLAGCHTVMIPDLSEADENLETIIDYKFKSLKDVVRNLF